MMPEPPTPCADDRSDAPADAVGSGSERRLVALIVGCLLLGFLTGFALLLYALTVDWQR